MNNFSALGIVLKRSSTGEADRIVTVLTKEYGKLTCVAKGARKLNSSKLGYLEPGCLVKMYLIKTKGLPILTQVALLEEFTVLRSSLTSIRKLFQVLEMLDVLLVEADAQREIFAIALEVLLKLEHEEENKTNTVRLAFGRILKLLGFDAQNLDDAMPLRDHIEELTARKLKAFAYLST